jgi:hypothetical protein
MLICRLFTIWDLSLEKEREMENAPLAEGRSPRIDSHLNKFSQAGVVLLTGLAFVLQLPSLVLIAALLLAWSALFPEIGPFRLLYRFIVVPLGLLKPRIVEDDPVPHRFAQGIGTAFLVAASLILFLSGATTVGWVLDLIVFVLSALNFTISFCAGCMVYYYLGRLGLLPRVRYGGGFRWRGV